MTPPSSAPKLRSLVALCLIAFALPWLLSGQESETPGPEQAQADPDTLSDEALQSRIQGRLAAVPGLEDVTVSFEGGIVTLSGSVSDSSLRASAQEIVAASPSVIEVKNQLLLGGEIRDRVGYALDRSVLKLKMLVGYLPLFVVAAILVALFTWFARLASGSGLARKLVGRNRFLQEIAAQGLKIGIILIGVIIALDLLDATALVGAVFGAAGLAGLAIGFAFRDLIENYVASLLLSVRRPFRHNDHVVIDGNEGHVISLTTRATVLMTLDGNHLRLPNSLVFKSVILNYTTNKERRFDFVVGVGGEEDLEAAQAVGVATMVEMDGVMQDPPPSALIETLADSNVSIRFFGWVDQSVASFGKARSEAIRLVKGRLEAEGMDLPEPIHRVRLENWKLAAPPPSDAAPAKPAPSKPLRQADVSRDQSIERQVQEEATKTDPRNLLFEDAPSE